MKKLSIIAGLLIVLSFSAHATLQITVNTDKDVYHLGEYVAISITAYNPNPQEVTLNFSGRLATYTIDDIFNLANWPFFPRKSIVTIQPNTTFTWQLIHDYWPTQEYPLSVGIHTVIGQLWAEELGENNITSPIQFEVIPEPTTFLLLTFGIIVTRYKKHIEVKSVF
jgi:hypothetical protein